MANGEKNSYQRIQEAVQIIRNRVQMRPTLGIILGSGLGSVCQELTETVTIPYSEIPYFHPTSVVGHAGQLMYGKLNGVPTICMLGRFHAYEGYSQREVIFPTRVLCSLGIKTLILTNAAGGINTRFRPGDLMVIDDHLNLTGGNPLIGPNLSELGPRFPDLTEAYSLEARKIVQATATQIDMPIHSGVYAGLIGPTYETPAEVRMLRILGADAVGMSTVSEAIAANHFGIPVFGISCITNFAAGLSRTVPTHAEVLEVSKIGADRLRRILVESAPQLAKMPANMSNKTSAPDKV